MSSNSTNTSGSRIPEIKALIKAFNNAQSSFRSYGANDTEPDSVFQELLLAAIENEPANVPNTASGWELFADQPGVSVAAKTLTAIATDIVEQIENLPLKDYKEMKTFLKEYCWRFN